jgi:hypothetical protein
MEEYSMLYLSVVNKRAVCTKSYHEPLPEKISMRLVRHISHVAPPPRPAESSNLRGATRRGEVSDSKTPSLVSPLTGLLFPGC